MRGYKSYSRRRQVHTLQVDGNISTGDEQAHEMILAREERVIGVVAGLTGLGTTSGDTSVMVRRTRAGTAADIIDSTVDIAYDATDYWAEAAESALQNRDLQRGDILSVDVDSVPGGGNATNLVVKVITHITKDEE